MQLFAIQEKKNKCYYLSKTTDITNAIDELKNSDDDVKKYFEKIGWDKCKTEYITEFDISILDQIKNKSGEYYDMLKDDDFNLNINLESCMNIPDHKQKKETTINTKNNETIINENNNNDSQDKKIICECGASIQSKSKNRHEKTKAHLTKLNKE